MGRLKNSPIGKLIGKAGHIVGRDFGYDHFISVRPKNYNIKKMFKAVSSKQRFHTVVRLAKVIVMYPDLKRVWNECKMPGKRGYNRIISANIKLLKDNLPTTENIITPKGRDLLFSMIEVTNKGMKCSYNMAGLIKPRICITFIILFYNPINEEDDLNYILVDRSYVEPQHADKCMDKKGENYLGEYNFGDYVNVGRKLYKNAILYAAVTGTSTIKNKKWWTSTVAVDISKFKLKLQFLPQGNKSKGTEGRKNISILININSKKYKKQQC